MPHPEDCKDQVHYFPSDPFPGLPHFMTHKLVNCGLAGCGFLTRLI